MIGREGRAMPHTPGPWESRSLDSGQTFNIIGAAGKVVPWSPVNPNDARLIAVAPELLEQCQDAAMHLEIWAASCAEGTFAESLRELARRLKAVCAKAEGPTEASESRSATGP